MDEVLSSPGYRPAQHREHDVDVLRLVGLPRAQSFNDACAVESKFTVASSEALLISVRLERIKRPSRRRARTSTWKISTEGLRPSRGALLAACLWLCACVGIGSPAQSGLSGEQLLI